MNLTDRRLFFRILPLAGLTVLGLCCPVSFALAPEEPSFNRNWQRNEDESDDPQEKLKEAFAPTRGPGGPPGGFGGGGRPAGGGPGGRGGGGRPGGPPGMRGGPQDPFQIADEMETVLKDNEFHVVPSGEGRVAIYYLDGKKHSREAPDGSKIETRAERKGDSIVAEQKTEQGMKTITTYELAPDGARMIVTTQIEGGRVKGPIRIRTVYDSAPSSQS